MFFFHYILHRFGPETFHLFKLWAPFNTKIAAKGNRRMFLLTCRTSCIFPRHITQEMEGIHCLTTKKEELKMKLLTAAKG